MTTAINCKTIGFVSLALLLFVAGCSIHKTHQVGTHRVTVSRYRYEKSLTSDNAGNFQFEGESTAGETLLKVTINGDKVRVNGVDYGLLRPGDSVYLGDRGVAVNELDYDATQKYLRENASNQANAAKNQSVNP
jgi:hypothetical protein